MINHEQNDNLVRVHNGLGVRRLTGFAIGQHEIDLSVYGFAGYCPPFLRTGMVIAGSSQC